MAKVKVQSFAEIKDALGSDEIEVEIDENTTIRDVFEKMAEEYGSAFKDQIWNKLTGEMEPFLVTLEPATVKSEKLSTHDGEEFIFVLEGEMEAILGGHKDVLHPGDSIYYNSTIPHKVQCHRNIPTKILAVIWAPQ